MRANFVSVMRHEAYGKNRDWVDQPMPRVAAKATEVMNGTNPPPQRLSM